MATTNVAAIQKLYVAYFNRPADALGLQAWEDAMARGATIDDIAKAFATSDEYKATYAGLNAVSTIAAIYQNLFGREADVDGLKFWAGHLQAGDFTVDVAVKLIADAAQGTDATIVANRVSYATAFTNALDTTPEVVGYSGTAANNAAKTALSGITTDASLTAAIAPAALNATVANVIDAANTAAGQKFVLTTGVDTFVGTSANDTFTINTYTAAGTNATTLQSFDSIDGGAGVDTLNLYAASGFNNVLSGSVKNVELINIIGSDAIGSSLTATQLASIATARENVTTAQTALTAAQAAETTANANVTVVTASSTVISAYVNAIDTTTAPDTTDIAFAAVVSAVGQATSDATKNFVLNYLNSHKTDIYNDTVLIGTPPVPTTVPRDAAGVLAAAIDAANTAADLAVSNAEGAATTASNTADDRQDDLDAANLALSALPTANHASVNAAFFAGSTQIKVDGSLTDITGLTSQNVVFTGANVTNNLTYGANATTGTVTLTGTRGTINVDGAKLATVNLNGTVSKAGAAAGTVTLVEGSAVDTDVVKTLNVGLTSAAKLDVAGLTALTTIAAGAATGALNIVGAGSTVSSITTGSGADTVTLATALSSTVKTASVTTGAGADDITVNLTGTGTGLTATVDAGDGNDTIRITNTGGAAMTIKAGAGNDIVIFQDLDTVATADLVDGGAGNDTIAIAGTKLQAGDYVVLNETVTNFENVAFLGAQTEVDASRIASYKSITLSNAEGSVNGSLVDNVANDQTIAIHTLSGSDDVVSIVSSGYDNSGASTVYAGTLNINVTAATEDDALFNIQNSGYLTVNASASAVNLSVASTADADVWVKLDGDVKTATITLADAATVDANDVQDGINYAEVDISVDATHNANLTTVTLSGKGYVEIDNAEGAHLATVNASALIGQSWDYDAEEVVVGESLQYRSTNVSTVETITLGTGAGSDLLQMYGSTYKAMDTITNLQLVLDVDASTATNKVLDTNVSDILEVGSGQTGIYSFTAVAAADLTGNSLGTILRNLGLQSAADGATEHNFVFQYQGNTYVYADIGANGAVGTHDGLTDSDVVVKLTGAIDLDLLKQALAYAD